jgi:hypothetical protein
MTAMKGRLFWILGFMFLLNGNSFAQVYRQAVGIRGNGNLLGFSFVQRIAPSLTGEVILERNPFDSHIAGTVRFHKSTFGPRLNSYFGIGGQAGFVRYAPGTFVGLNTQFGLEYKLPLLPIQTSIDLMPMINIGPHPKNLYLQVALGIRYVTKKDETRGLRGVINQMKSMP